MPWCSDGPSEAELGGTLETTLSDWADAATRRAARWSSRTCPNPNGEPADADRDRPGRRGRDDRQRAVRAPRVLPLPERRLPAAARRRHRQDVDARSRSACTGPMRSSATSRSRYDAWRRAVVAGRTFLSGGPLLTLDGRRDARSATPSAWRGRGTVAVVATAESVFPFSTLEIVQNGQVVAATAE